MMRRLQAIVAALLLLGALRTSPLSAQAVSRDGRTTEWHGTLMTPQGALSLLVRLRTGADSAPSGELESVTQAPGHPIPLGNVTITSDSLTFTVPAIGARYTGRWEAHDSAWVGTFSQGLSLPLTLLPGAPAPRPTVAGLDGTWRGLLVRDAARLHFILRVTSSVHGTTAALDSPDVGFTGIGVEQLEHHGDSVRFTVPAAQAQYAGTLSPDQHALSGTWTRSNLPTVSLTFTRDSTQDSTRHERTQWPITPRGYHAVDVTFPNARAPGVTLAGTLTLPDGPGPFPAAVLLSGSGAQDRDETLFDHKPFAVLADDLSRHGIAVLRFDDRGFGASTGDFAAATSADFASDGGAALTFLLAQAGIDPRAVGVIGHSEGGMTAPMLAAEDPRVKFVVMLAGPGIPITRLVRSQQRMMGAAEGRAPASLAREGVMRDSLFERVRSSSTDSAEAHRQLRLFLTDARLAALGATPSQRDLLVAQYGGPWWRYFLRYDPARVLARVHVPVLALNGSLDRQVIASENLPAIATALRHNPDVTIAELPGLNHLFQHAVTGAVSEYATIAETFSPEAMARVHAWLAARFLRGGQ